ncbi:Sorting nexin lst-4 [Hypsizygus marmoreus]|uniref:Sorting nexin lst-4 n=1 Tax=Hypsizygus marmoreus TaxID=39966 RepID=A0A369KDE0_HYPMA|nr:Sorting nexin lst-4 [Hypsizygus marmoreus]
MATLPRASKYPSASSSSFFQRPQSEFDAGINTSTAWTEHLVSGSGSLSDEEPDDDEDTDGQKTPLHPARALYDFEGKAEFRELSVSAGDALEIVKEDLADGWSLVKNATGEVGLLPRTYYTFTLEFTPAPDLELPPSYTRHGRKEASSAESITPRGSPKSSSLALPIVPQNTGEWRNAFPSFRQSLLGGKSLNRFSSFVTSGAEEFVLKGPATDVVIVPDDFSPSHDRDASDTTIDEEEMNRLSRLGLGEADRHFVDAGPAWKEKIPPFRVLVHSPSKRASVLSGAFTVYNVTSLFHSPTIPEADENDQSAETDVDYIGPPRPASPTRITVHRRFSHFVMLHTALTRRLPGIALPPLPEKQYAGRFSEDFVEARRGDLERYIDRIVRHPVARYAEVVTFFLGCESETEWKRLVPQHLSMPPAGPAFYARVFHPAFNLDAEDAEEAVDRFDMHTKAVGKGVQGLRNIFGRIREARVEMSKAERLLAYSLLSLITSKPLASAPMTGVNEEDDQYDVKSKGLHNADGAWCWREGCQDCLKLTKAMQKTSETLQNVADLYDDHARRTQLATHESLKGMAHPSSLYEGVVTTHNSTLSRYKEATLEGRSDEEMAARCETVLNTTMAEMETYHTQKTEDFRTLTKEHLDGEIAFYEQVLSRMKAARRTFDGPQFDQLGDSPRQPSIYERELENPRLTAKPLPQPCPHVFDSAPMRPVSVAIQGGVGLFLGPSTRGSVFGKFW